MADSNTPNTNADIDKLKTDLQSVREDIAKLAHSVGDQAQNRARAGADNLRQAAGSAGEELQAASQLMEGQIASHPYASVGAAFGVGLLLGMALERR